jgi:DME family drug/metabolite transporter
VLPITPTVGKGIPAPQRTVSAVLRPGPDKLAYSSYFTGLRHTGPEAALIALLLEPLTAALLAALANHEYVASALLRALLILFSSRSDRTPQLDLFAP